MMTYDLVCVNIISAEYMKKTTIIRFIHIYMYIHLKVNTIKYLILD